MASVRQYHRAKFDKLLQTMATYFADDPARSSDLSTSADLQEWPIKEWNVVRWGVDPSSYRAASSRWEWLLKQPLELAVLSQNSEDDNSLGIKMLLCTFFITYPLKTQSRSAVAKLPTLIVSSSSGKLLWQQHFQDIKSALRVWSVAATGEVIDPARLDSVDVVLLSYVDIKNPRRNPKSKTPAPASSKLRLDEAVRFGRLILDDCGQVNYSTWGMKMFQALRTKVDSVTMIIDEDFCWNWGSIPSVVKLMLDNPLVSAEVLRTVKSDDDYFKQSLERLQRFFEGITIRIPEATISEAMQIPTAPGPTSLPRPSLDSSNPQTLKIGSTAANTTATEFPLSRISSPETVRTSPTTASTTVSTAASSLRLGENALPNGISSVTSTSVTALGGFGAVNSVVGSRPRGTVTEKNASTRTLMPATTAQPNGNIAVRNTRVASPSPSTGSAVNITTSGTLVSTGPQLVTHGITPETRQTPPTSSTETPASISVSDQSPRKRLRLSQPTYTLPSFTRSDPEIAEIRSQLEDANAKLAEANNQLAEVSKQLAESKAKAAELEVELAGSISDRNVLEFTQLVFAYVHGKASDSKDGDLLAREVLVQTGSQFESELGRPNFFEDPKAMEDGKCNLQLLRGMMTGKAADVTQDS